MGNDKRKVLGVLGGMGAIASAYFYELVNRHTAAVEDQDFLDMVISSRSTTPDRSAFILGESMENPAKVMAEEAQKLEQYGAGVLAIACNTAHYFYNTVADAVHVPVLNMVELTVEKAAAMGCTTLGILGTTGTVHSGIFQKACKARGLDCVTPGPHTQEAVMYVIYENIKAGRPPDLARFNYAAEDLFSAGCQRLVLGCTELSLLKRDGHTDGRFIDSMEVLAETAIHACGGKTQGFDWPA